MDKARAGRLSAALQRMAEGKPHRHLLREEEQGPFEALCEKRPEAKKKTSKKKASVKKRHEPKEEEPQEEEKSPESEGPQGEELL